MKKLLGFLFLVMLVPSICSAALTPTAEFTFDGHCGNLVNGEDGKQFGNVKYGKGFLNDAIYLDGDGDYIDYGKGYNLGRNFTFNVWIKPDKENLQRKWATIFAKYETNNYGPYWFGLYYGSPDYWLSDGKGNYQEHISKTKLNPDTWYMLTYTYDYGKQQLSIYINGNLDSSFPCVPVIQNNDKVTVGRQALMFQPYSNLQYKGWIDEIQIYDETLRADYIKAIYKRYSDMSSANNLVRPPANKKVKISQPEVLKNLVLSMKHSKKGSANEILDEAISSSSNGNFKSNVDLIEKFLKDYERTREFDNDGNVTQESKDKFLKNYCGIDLHNEDVGAVTGSDIGYSNIPKNAENIVPENGEYYNIHLYIKNLKIFELKDVTYMRTVPSSLLGFKKGNLTVDLLEYENYNESERSIVNAIYSWWLDSAINLIEKSYGLNFDKTASVHQIRLSVSKLINPANILKLQSIILDENTFASTHVYLGLEGTQGWGDLLPKTLSLAIQLNEKSVGTLQQPISLSNPSGQSSTNYTYWDRIFTHEMVHATMAANINYYWKLPTYITEGLAELVVGGDDTRGGDSPTDSEYYILLNNMNELRAIYYSNGGGQYSGGCMLLRYFAKQVADASNEEKISGNNTSNIPSDAFTYNGHHYYIYSKVAGVNTWEDTKKYCEKLGGHLAVINDKAENDALYYYITSRGHKTAYFGLSDSAGEGKWKWLDDSVTYYNWFNGEPNGERGENYAEFYYKFTDGRWNDGNFGHGTQNDSKTFICEWDS